MKGGEKLNPLAMYSPYLLFQGRDGSVVWALDFRRGRSAFVSWCLLPPGPPWVNWGLAVGQRPAPEKHSWKPWAQSLRGLALVPNKGPIAKCSRTDEMLHDQFSSFKRMRVTRDCSQVGSNSCPKIFSFKFRTSGFFKNYLVLNFLAFLSRN